MTRTICMTPWMLFTYLIYNYKTKHSFMPSQAVFKTSNSPAKNLAGHMAIFMNTSWPPNISVNLIPKTESNNTICAKNYIAVTFNSCIELHLNLWKKTGSNDIKVLITILTMLVNMTCSYQVTMTKLPDNPTPHITTRRQNVTVLLKLRLKYNQKHSVNI